MADMRHFAAVVGLLALAGCTSAQMQKVQATGADVVTAAARACALIQPVTAAAAVVPDPRVQSILAFAGAVCAPLAAGQTPPNLDTNTAAWLGNLAGMLKVLVPGAPHPL